MPNGDRMCAAIWRPSWRPIVQACAVGRLPEVDLAAHDHVDELVARREPLLLDAASRPRILVAGRTLPALSK